MNIVLFREGETMLSLSDERASHILKVLRMKEGDSFHAGIINSMEGMMRIERISDDGIELLFSPEKDSSALYPLTLICAQVRPICMRRILREAVSLGVGRMILPVSDLGEKSYLNASLYKDGEYRDILLDGAMQAGKTGVTDTVLASGVEEAIKLADSDTLLLLDNVIGAVPLSEIDLRGKSVAVAIGPERGWSERERRVFLDSGFIPAIMGSRILRTETAAVASVALALSRMGYL